MNARGTALLVNPHPCGHIVYPYTDENLVGQAVALFASAGLRNGEGVILIMSAAHCESIRLRLDLEGIPTEAYERFGRLICVTAEELLSKFVRDGALDENIFKLEIGRLIETAQTSAGDRATTKVRIFGEMVSQLRNKDLDSTERLEQLWNDVIKDHAVSLLCTYALHGSGDHIPEVLVRLHSHSLELESPLL